MKERIRIGFNYDYSPDWMGGMSYAYNLLKALNMLEDEDKPYIDVYCRDEKIFDDLKCHTKYPYLNMVIVRYNLFLILVYRRIVGFLFGRKAKAKINFFKILPEDKMIYSLGFGSETKKMVYWQPDLQEKHFPAFFSHKEIKRRDNAIRMVAERGIPIVFSSYDSENDYKRYYSEYNNKTFVVHFAAVPSNFKDINIIEVKKKYGIKDNYLLCANQFWKHKNHLFLFRAYQKAYMKGLNMQLVCTGLMSDYRNPNYIESVRHFIIQNNMEELIITPGLIDKKELYCLIANSYAVIQPSLFEGWNTTVEDCKALGKFVFLSDIPVHKEQIRSNVCFFDPHNEDDLVDKLLNVKPTSIKYDYNVNVREFGENFLKVIRYVTSK